MFINYPILLDLDLISQCISGFMTSDEIKIQAREITEVKEYSNKERYFPDIGFTCNGNITHIIIGAEDRDKTQLPQIYFWRLSDEGQYEQTGSFYSLVYNDANDPSTTNLRWYNLSQPIQVQNGDVLGIYQPRKMNSDLTIYYQKESGPPNYDNNGILNNINDYPLVSVIFGKYFVPYRFTMYFCVYKIATCSSIVSEYMSVIMNSTLESASSTTSITSEVMSSMSSIISETTGPLSISTSKTTSFAMSITSEAVSSTISSTIEGEFYYLFGKVNANMQTIDSTY